MSYRPKPLARHLLDQPKRGPTIVSQQRVAKSRLFDIEALHLRFSNGEERHYERMAGSQHNAVMIVPLRDAQTLLLIREYAVGTHSYQLGFPKGLIDTGEDCLQAGNRELMEETGLKAEQLTWLTRLILAPSYFASQMDILLAQNLSPQNADGDEPEAIEVIEWPVAQLDELLARADFCDARSVAALLWVQRWLNQQQTVATK